MRQEADQKRRRVEIPKELSFKSVGLSRHAPPTRVWLSLPEARKLRVTLSPQSHGSLRFAKTKSTPRVQSDGNMIQQDTYRHGVWVMADRNLGYSGMAGLDGFEVLALRIEDRKDEARRLAPFEWDRLAAEMDG